MALTCYENGELSDDWATASFGYASAMQEHFPEIEADVRIDISQTEGVVGYEESPLFIFQIPVPPA